MRWRIPPKWGIRIFSAWALILAVLAVSRLLLLTQAVEFLGDPNDNQAQLWLIFAINSVMAVGFAASAYGLWRHHRWGRLTFLWVIGLWSGFNMLVLFIPNLVFSAAERSWPQLIFNGVRYGLGLGVSLLYLNLPQIKSLFDREPAASTDTKGSNIS